jgi:hypothetical protein
MASLFDRMVVVVDRGRVVSDNAVASLAGTVISTATVLVSIIVLVALRRCPRLRTLADVISSRTSRQVTRVRDRLEEGVASADTDTLERLVSFHIPRSRWAEAGALALINWMSGAACFVVAILAL